MKVKSYEQNAALTSGEMLTVDMGISQNAEDQLMILNVLSNTLYTDKIAAVLREYGCNAYDANVEANRGDIPIEVRLPNKLEPTLAIRDHGFGMTQEQIMTVFCKLGRSTKRGSNEYTGMLGIGSKAGFAYGDQFNVTSWTGGTRTIYTCYRDKGMPKLTKLDEKTNTGEPDGVEVKVPIHQVDIAQFAVVAERVYRYFKVAPKITGAKVDFHRPKASQQGTGWRYIGDGHSYVIMGNVGYDIKPDSLGDKLTPKGRTLLELGIELDFKIGEVEIAANREGLQYRDVTIKAILTKMAHILAEVGTIFSNQIAAAKNLWEAKKLYYELFQRTGDYGHRSLKDAVSDKVSWQGKPVTSGKYEIGSKFDAYATMNQGLNKGLMNLCVIRKPDQWTRRRQRENRWIDWYARDTFHIVINDLPSKKNSPTRESGFFAANPTIERVLLLAFEDDKAKDTWWKKFEFDGHPFTLLSTVTPLKTANTTGIVVPSIHKAKHQASAFVLKESSNNTSTSSMYWDIISIDPLKGKGVYVELSRFDPLNSKSYGSSAYSFKEMIVALRGAGLLKTVPKIYGFKDSWFNRNGKKPRTLGAGWEKFEDVILDEMQKFLTGKEQAYANFIESQKHQDFVTAKNWAAVPKGNSLREYIDQLETMKQCAHASLFEWLTRGTHKNWIGTPPSKLPKPVVNLDTLKQKVFTEFPMLRLWGSSYYRDSLRDKGKDEIKLAIEYVNMVTSI